MIRIAVFASGSGTNAENLVRYFEKNGSAKISLILTNNQSAGVIDRSKNLNIPCMIIPKKQFVEKSYVLNILRNESIDFIILAGFLLLVPQDIIYAYKDRILNIHPALLPLHGGKGFYGENVHKAVIDSGAIMSGITIHQVNERFDEGEIIFQAGCYVEENETAESLAVKIHLLEYSYFPIVVEKYILNHLSKGLTA